MRIALLADIHGNVRALDAALAVIDEAGADRILVGGDVVGYYPAVNEVIDRLRDRDAIAVSGNHDAMLLGRLPCTAQQRAACRLDVAEATLTARARSWLETLPNTRRMSIGGRRVLMAHGTPWEPLTEYAWPDELDRDRFAAVDADLVVLGHTHRAFLATAGAVTVVNPGSCGQPRGGRPGAAFAICDADDGTITHHHVDYDRHGLRRELERDGCEPALIEILFRGNELLRR